MRTLKLDKINYGSHSNEKPMADYVAKFDRTRIDLDVDEVLFVLPTGQRHTLDMAEDGLSQNFTGRFENGAVFRIVAPGRIARTLGSDFLTIASEHPDGYAVHFDFAD